MIKLEKLIDRIELEDKQNSYLLGTTTVWFKVPKEILGGKYPDAESAELMIEFISKNPHSFCPSVMLSPTKDGLDYDWNDISLEYDDIRKLVELATEE